mgnify:FL=1
MSELTAVAVRAVVNYDAKTGVLTRRVTHGRGVKVGDVAGCKNAQGYVMLYVNGKVYAGHRIVWLYMTGRWPHKIDHINGDHGDNRFANLRHADDQVNNQNRRRANANNKSGLLGVNKCGGKFRATIVVDGVKKHIGLFPTAEQPHEAYVRTKRKTQEWGTL